MWGKFSQAYLCVWKKFHETWRKKAGLLRDFKQTFKKSNHKNLHLQPQNSAVRSVTPPLGNVTGAYCKKKSFHEGMIEMDKIEQLYEGKAKKVYATENPNVVIVSYKDDATAFDGLKKGTITGKGVINNQMTNFLMQQLEKAGVPTHFVEELSERETAVKKVAIIPLEVIIRNVSAGSFAKRYGVEEGIVFDAPTIEFSYKNDDLHDPLINGYHAVALKLATWEEIELIKKYAFQVNDFLKQTLAECGVTLVDFKLEFGKTADGAIVLADEISPDTCRFWDSKTGEKLDKDRFRRDLGNVEGAYQEMSRRLMGK